MRNQLTYSSTDLINNHRIYSDYLQLGIDDGWGKEDKLENFKVMLEITQLTNYPIKGSTILDVGCGTGDLVSYLSTKEIKEYTGIDVFEPAIEKARQKFPDETFIADDFLHYNFKKQFDFIFCSGALTTNLDTDNYKIITFWILKMWQLAKRGVVFNFLTAENQKSNDLFFYEPDRVFNICQNQIPQAKIETVTTSAGMGNNFQEIHVFLF